MVRSIFLLVIICLNSVMYSQYNTNIEFLDEGSSMDELLSKYLSLESQNIPISAVFSRDEIFRLHDYFETTNTQKEKNLLRSFGESTIYGALDIPSEESFISFELTSVDIINSISYPSVVGVEFCGAIYDSQNHIGYAFGSEGNFYEIDILTGAYTHLGIIPTSNGNSNWGGMEYDSTTGLLYAISSNGADYVVSSIDVETLTITELPNSIGFSPQEVIVGMAIDGEGIMYIHEIENDNIWVVDKTTGEGTLLGPTGFNANYLQGMSYDPETDTIYLAAFNYDNANAELRSVDVNSGATTYIEDIGASVPGGYVQVTWISFYKDSTLSNNEFDRINALSIYPNPVINTLNISAKEVLDVITIFNIQGQIVLTENVNANSANIDLSTLSNGIYLVRLNSSNKLVNHKFIKN